MYNNQHLREIPHYSQGCPTMINDFVISEEKILNIIRSLNPNKAHGWDEISIRMIKLNDASLVTPLEIIFTNCLRHCVFPEMWKRANFDYGDVIHSKHLSTKFNGKTRICSVFCCPCCNWNMEGNITRKTVSRAWLGVTNLGVTYPHVYKGANPTAPSVELLSSHPGCC